LPYFRLDDERYKTITVRQMLSHTSGIPDTVNYNWDKPEYDAGASSASCAALRSKTCLRAGEKFAYSNTAYEMLGDVIAKVSVRVSKTMCSTTSSRVGMKDSTLLVREANPQLLTSPHVMESGKVVVSKIFPTTRAFAQLHTLFKYRRHEPLGHRKLNRGELDDKRI